MLADGTRDIARRLRGRMCPWARRRVLCGQNRGSVAQSIHGLEQPEPLKLERVQKNRAIAPKHRIVVGQQLQWIERLLAGKLFGLFDALSEKTSQERTSSIALKASLPSSLAATNAAQTLA